MFSSNIPHDRRLVLGKMTAAELVSLVVELEQKFKVANDHKAVNNNKNIKYNTRLTNEKNELRDRCTHLKDQLNVLFADMSIPPNTKSLMYKDLRNRLKEMSNYQLSSNLSVGSKSNSGSSSKRSYEDLQSGCDSNDNIIYMLNCLVNKLFNQKTVLCQNNKRLEQDNKLCNEHCRVIGVRNKELEEKDNDEQSLQTRIVDLTNQGNDWKQKYEEIKHGYNVVMEEDIKSTTDERISTGLLTDCKKNFKRIEARNIRLIHDNAKLNAQLIQSAGIGSTLGSLRYKTHSESSSNISAEDCLFQSPYDRRRRNSIDSSAEKQKKLAFKIERNEAISQILNKKLKDTQAQHKQTVATKNKELYGLFLNTKYLIEGRYFQPIDVDGDGNCLFNALLASGHLSPHDYTSLRQTICNHELNSETDVIKKIYDAFQRSGSTENFKEHFVRMKNNAVHASERKYCGMGSIVEWNLFFSKLFFYSYDPR